MSMDAREGLRGYMQNFRVSADPETRMVTLRPRSEVEEVSDA